MPENEKSFIEQEEAKMERRQFLKVSAKDVREESAWKNEFC